MIVVSYAITYEDNPRFSYAKTKIFDNAKQFKAWFDETNCEGIYTIAVSNIWELKG